MSVSCSRLGCLLVPGVSLCVMGLAPLCVCVLARGRGKSRAQAMSQQHPSPNSVSALRFLSQHLDGESLKKKKREKMFINLTAYLRVVAFLKPFENFCFSKL